jgi:AcrR family transcriptional regulator
MPKIIDKKKKAALISDAALKVFRELGYHRTRMADIAQAAGIGKGTLYEYFKDKADILCFAFDQYFSIFAEGILEALKDKLDPSAKLLSLIDFSLRHAAEWEDHCVVYIDYFGAARTDEGGRFPLSAMYGQIKTILINLIREGQGAGEIDGGFDPVALSELLISVFDGIILHRLFEGQGADRESLRKAATRFIKNALLTPIVRNDERFKDSMEG